MNVWKVISVALIYKDNKVLIGLRFPKDDQPALWEFPGGSVEKGEQPEEAMIREIKEELNIQVTSWKFARSLCDDKQGILYLICFHHVLKWNGEIQKKCHQKLRWISHSEIQKEKLPNINPRLFDKILSVLSDYIKSS